jgi:5'-nucleotidase
MPESYQLTYSKKIDFSAAAHFTRTFATLLLEGEMPFDVDVLKVDIPSSASEDTPWRLCRLSPVRYYETLAPERDRWDTPGKLGYRQASTPENHPADSDVYVLRALRHVAVSPLSLDLTSRVDFGELDRLLRAGAE